MLISTGFTVASGCFGFWIPEYVDADGAGATGLVAAAMPDGAAVRFNNPVAALGRVVCAV